MTLWNDLTTEDGIQAILSRSHTQPQLIFKHSTTCGISAQVYEGLLAATPDLAQVMGLHYLDLLTYRPVSNAVAAILSVRHQSPQALLISKGEVIASSSHFSVTPEALLRAVSGKTA